VQTNARGLDERDCENSGGLRPASAVRLTLAIPPGGDQLGISDSPRGIASRASLTRAACRSIVAMTATHPKELRMKFLSTRELRNRPGYVRDLVQKDDLVLTASGKPIAILLGIEEDELEETARAIRQAKAQLALSRLRKQAARRRADRMSASAIDADIRAVRSRRKST